MKLAGVGMIVMARLVLMTGCDCPQAKQDETAIVDVANDASVTLHSGDYVRFKHGFYGGVEGDIVGVDEGGLYIVRASKELHDINNYLDTVRGVKAETLEVIPRPTVAPDLFDPH